MGRGISPGQVPDWRPGAVYWRPLLDGREVTIYPLLYDGQARLCVGPLAADFGYDIAYVYESKEAAIEAAEKWDAEEEEHPEGYISVGGRSGQIEREIPQVGQHVLIKKGELFRAEKQDQAVTRISVRRQLQDGRLCIFAGLEKRDVDGNLFVEVEEVAVDAPPEGGEMNPMLTSKVTSATAEIPPPPDWCPRCGEVLTPVRVMGRGLVEKTCESCGWSEKVA